MKKNQINKIFAIFLFSCYPAAAYPAFFGGGVSLDLDSSVYTNMISGEESSSILREGSYSVHDLSMRYTRDIEAVRIETGVSGRISDDIYESDERFRLNRWYVGLNSLGRPLEYNLKVGNVYGELSDYTFSQALTGLSGYIQLRDFTLKPVYGTQHYAENNIRYRRDTLGLSAGQIITDRLSLSVNFAEVKDIEGSVKDDADIDALEENSVRSLDINFDPSRNISFSGSYAQSAYEEKKGSLKEEGEAYKIATGFLAGEFRMNADYEYASPSFNSLGGYAVGDRKRVGGVASYRLFNRAEVRVSYENFRNNLEGSLPYSTIVSVPSFSSLINIRRGMSMEAGYRERISVSDDSPKTVDRITRSYTAGINWRLRSISFNANGGLSGNTDKKDSANNYDNISARIGGRGSFPLGNGGLRVMPSLIYSYSRDALESGDNDTSLSVNAAASFLLSENWGFDLRNNNSDIRRESTSTNSKRNTFTALVRYRFSEELSRSIEASYTMMDFTGDTKDKDFSERVFRLSSTLRF